MSVKNPLGITELALRDAQQSLLATRMRIDDMVIKFQTVLLENGYQQPSSES